MNRNPRRNSSGAGPKATAPAAAALYQRAAHALETGQLAEAERLFRMLLADLPGNASVLHALGLVAMRGGRLADAKKLIEKSLAKQPNVAELHNSLGCVFIELNQPDKALRELATALRLQPTYPHAHANRARALLALDRPVEAIESSREALALLPNFLDAWMHLGNGLLTIEQPSEAADAFAHAVALSPGQPNARINLGLAAIEQGRPDLAEVEFRQALAVAPQSVDGHEALGNLLSRMGRLREAQTVFENLLRLAPDHAQGLLGLADTLLQLGDQDQAFALYTKAVDRHPDNALVYTSLGSAYATAGRHDAATETLKAALRFESARASVLTQLMQIEALAFDDPLIEQAERLLDPGGRLKWGDRVRLQLALGKTLLKSGDDTRAFAHIDAANALKRAHIDFDIESAEHVMQAIADQSGPALFDRLRGAGVPSELPIFIVGMPRSGTTLVEQILASHPEIWGAGELTTMTRLVEGLPPPGYPAFLAQADAGALTRLGEAYLAEVLPMAHGRARLVDKLPANFSNVGLIALALPGARFIHCQRDAVDTCLSCYSLNFTGHQPFCYDQAELGRYWLAYDALMAHWRTVLPADRFIDVRYEDVVADVETQARRLIDFAGLPWNDACLSFHATERVVRTASMSQIRRPIYTQSVKRWTRHARHLQPLLNALKIAAPD